VQLKENFTTPTVVQHNQRLYF